MYLAFLHPQIPDYQIVVSRLNIVLTNHESMESLFNPKMYFQKMNTFYIFCG